MVNICAGPQIEDSWWFFHLFPEAVARMRHKHIPAPALIDAFGEAGLAWQGRHVALDAVIQGDHYLDWRGPLDPQWRATDSFWAGKEVTAGSTTSSARMTSSRVTYSA